MGYVVEFCGLPGAGKSTLARTVVARLRLRGVPTTEVMAPIGPDADRRARLMRKSAAVIRGAVEPGSIALAARVGLLSGQTAARDRVARPANLLVVRHAVRRAQRRPGVHVLDQGPLQEWWSAGLRAESAKILAFAANDRAVRSDLLVHIDTPVELLMQRLQARQVRQSRLEGLSPAERREELERGELLLASLIDQLVHSPGVPAPEIIRVDGLDTTAPEAIVEAVLRSV
jgi:thymidylate kinase